MHENDDASKLCSISMDEISLKTSLLYDSTKDEVVGVEDLGDGKRSARVATAAVVFMARGITGNWKQPLGYYLVNEACSSDVLKEKLMQIIDQVTSIGLKVHAVVSDLGTNFQKLLKDLKISPTKPWFMHNGRKIFYVFDTPHLIKAVRNNLLNYDFHFGKKVACWDHIVSMYERDKALTMRCCPKLSDSHMNLTGFTKMKVKYATQVLSHSVSATILTYVSLNALPAAAAGTAELISNFDKIFNCLNSSSLNSPKCHQRAISENSIHHKFLTDMVKFIRSIKVINRSNQQDITNQLKCLNGLVLTINSVLSLWSVLKEQESLEFLLTRRLNQDPLENFFGTIRQQGGNSDNPTPLQFTRAFRKLFYDHYLILPRGNCTEDLDSVLVDHQGKDVQKHTAQPESSRFEVNVTDYKTGLESNLIGLNAITYVSGYLVKKCLAKHCCDICTKELVNKQVTNSAQLFCFFKGYDELEKNPSGQTGGLITPSDNFVSYITGLEATFVVEFENNVSKQEIGKYLLSKLPKFSLLECPHFPSVFLLRLFIRMRIHYALKFGNRVLRSAKKKNRKYLKVAHW